MLFPQAARFAQWEPLLADWRAVAQGDKPLIGIFALQIVGAIVVGIIRG
jgi:hypothetical protein